MLRWILSLAAAALLSIVQPSPTLSSDVELNGTNAANGVWGSMPSGLPGTCPSANMTLVGQTDAECACAATRFTRNVIHQGSLNAAAVRSAKFSLSLLSIALGGAEVGLGEAAAVELGKATSMLEVLSMYLLAEDKSDFKSQFAQWATGKLVVAGVSRAVDDNVIEEAVGNLGDTAFDALLKSDTQIVSGNWSHPQCGEVRWRYSLLGPQDDGRRFSYQAIGNCKGEWPVAGDPSLYLFRFVGRFDLDIQNEMASLLLDVENPAFEVAAFCELHEDEPRIYILQASYGLNCMDHEVPDLVPRNATRINRVEVGNATPHIRRACDGRQSCDYKIDHNELLDPAYMCAKEYEVEFDCGPGTGGPLRIEVSPEASGKTIRLGC